MNFWSIKTFTRNCFNILVFRKQLISYLFKNIDMFPVRFKIKKNK